LGMYLVTLAIWATVPVAISGAPLLLTLKKVRTGRQSPFGNSIFDGEELELSPIGDVQYEYDAEDYEDEPNNDEVEIDELYDEEEYGDYEEKFIEPVPVETDYEYDESAGPFGASIFNLDDIETSPIVDIEYEYDYEDYNDIDDTVKEPSKDQSLSKEAPTTKPKTVITSTQQPTAKSVIVKDFPPISYNFKPIHQPSPPKFLSQPQSSPPKLQNKPRPAPVQQTRPNYSHRFTPAELQYMYGKHRQPKNLKPKAKPEQAAQTNPIQGLVLKLRNKVEKIVRFFTGE